MGLLNMIRYKRPHHPCWYTPMTLESIDDVVNRVAEQYLQKPETDLQEEYSALGTYNEERFEDIPVDVEFTPEDPYAGPEELFRAIDNGELKIYNGGSSPAGMTEEQNLKGRAVHDYFGHYKNQCGFSVRGEFEKWYNQKNDVPDETEDLLFSEVVGQVCLVHYLEGGFENDRFEQRSVLIDEDLKNEVVDFLTPIDGAQKP